MTVALVLQPEIQAFLNCMRMQSGFPYTWPTEENRYSGKGLPGCLYPHGRDCSGSISFALRGAGDATDRRADWNAHRYYSELEKTDRPEAGDLVVYVRNGHGVHIEAVMEDGRYYGAIGGDEGCTSPELAKQRDARVKYRESPYRRGEPVFLVNPLRKKAA